MSNNNKYRINIAEKYIGNHRDFFFQSNKQVGHDANRFDANKRGEFISPIQQLGSHSKFKENIKKNRVY